MPCSIAAAASRSFTPCRDLYQPVRGHRGVFRIAAHEFRSRPRGRRPDASPPAPTADTVPAPSCPTTKGNGNL